MVKILLPPPQDIPNPLLRLLPAGTTLYRIFSPGRHGVAALTFRAFGPMSRFDHHRGRLQSDKRLPAEDGDRRIYYAAFSLSGCLVECFGDTELILMRDQFLAKPVTTRDLSLLDLQGPGAMRSGANAALAKVADRSISQAWARYFYDHERLYTAVDGLIYTNAHNEEAALALFERAENSLDCLPQQVWPLADWRLDIMRAAAANNLRLPL